MPGQYITYDTVNVYQRARDAGCTQSVSAHIANISERSGSRIEQGEHQVKSKGESRLAHPRRPASRGVGEGTGTDAAGGSPALRPRPSMSTWRSDIPVNTRQPYARCNGECRRGKRPMERRRR